MGTLSPGELPCSALSPVPEVGAGLTFTLLASLPLGDLPQDCRRLRSGLCGLGTAWAQAGLGRAQRPMLCCPGARLSGRSLGLCGLLPCCHRVAWQGRPRSSWGSHGPSPLLGRSPPRPVSVPKERASAGRSGDHRPDLSPPALWAWPLGHRLDREKYRQGCDSLSAQDTGLEVRHQEELARSKPRRLGRCRDTGGGQLSGRERRPLCPFTDLLSNAAHTPALPGRVSAGPRHPPQPRGGHRQPPDGGKPDQVPSGHSPGSPRKAHFAEARSPPHRHRVGQLQPQDEACPSGGHSQGDPCGSSQEQHTHGSWGSGTQAPAWEQGQAPAAPPSPQQGHTLRCAALGPSLDAEG